MLITSSLFSQSQPLANQSTSNSNPVFENEFCCDLSGGTKLEIGFYRPTATWEDCTVIAGAATVFYPIDGSSGTIDVCINLPRTSPGQNFGVYELFDQGDFNDPTIDGNNNVICQTISYPTLDEDNEPIGHEVLTFYVVPLKKDLSATIRRCCMNISGKAYAYIPFNYAVFG